MFRFSAEFVLYNVIFNNLMFNNVMFNNGNTINDKKLLQVSVRKDIAVKDNIAKCFDFCIHTI